MNNHYTLHNYKHINYTHNKLINISIKQLYITQTNKTHYDIITHINALKINLKLK